MRQKQHATKFLKIKCNLSIQVIVYNSTSTEPQLSFPIDKHINILYPHSIQLYNFN